MVHRLNDHRSRLALVGEGPDVAFYAGKIRERGGPVLVLGCAHGRIAWELCKQGLDVVGVDPSQVMIRTAEARRAYEVIDVSRRLVLLHADLRSVRLSSKFSVVLAPHNALALLTRKSELASLMATVSEHLAPGGTFLFDCSNVQGPWRAALPDSYRLPFASHLRERGKGIRRLRLRQFSSADVDAALDEVGLKVFERFGQFDCKPFDAGDALQICVASRDAVTR